MLRVQRSLPVSRESSACKQTAHRSTRSWPSTRGCTRSTRSKGLQLRHEARPTNRSSRCSLVECARVSIQVATTIASRVTLPPSLSARTASHRLTTACASIDDTPASQWKCRPRTRTPTHSATRSSSPMARKVCSDEQQLPLLNIFDIANLKMYLR